MRYAIVIEKADGNYSAYVPNLPGCVATAVTVAAVDDEIREAIRFHIDGLIPIVVARDPLRAAMADLSHLPRRLIRLAF